MSASFRARVAGCVVAAAVTVLTGGSALGYFTTTGAGLVSAGVSSLSKPAFTTVSSGSGGSVTLNWSAVAAPGAGTVSYYLTRDGKPVAGTCPNAGAPSATTVCIDKEVPSGTHSYVVTAVWSTWSAASSPESATVPAGPAARFALSASGTTPTAGTSVNLTITAQDTYGNTATSYTGSKSLTFSGASASPGGNAPTVTNASGTAVAFGTATPITFTSGVATTAGSLNGVMTLYKNGATNVSVSDGTISTASPLAVTVANATPSKLVLAAETATPAVGAADPLTITAQDTYGNTATSYTGSKSLTFSGASASPGGNAPTVTNASGTAVAFGTATPITFTSGVATTSGSLNGAMRLYKSGAASVVATDGTVTSAAVTVTPPVGATSKLALSASGTTPTAGTSVNLTITAQDTYGNTATSYTGSKSLTFSGASASPGGNAPTVTNASGTAVAFGTATPITFTSGVATTAGSLNGVMTLYKNGATNVSVSDGTISTASPLAVTVANAALSKLVLAAETATPAVGAADPLTISALDTYGNTATSYTGSKSLTFSGASASPGGNAPTVTNASGTAVAFGTATPITFTSGVATISGAKNGVMTLYRAGAASISVSDGTISTASPLAVTVAATTASKLAFTHPVASAGVLSSPCYFTCTATSIGSSATIKAGVAVTDTYGNVVSGLGTGHSVAVTTTGGAVTGGTIAIPASGAAESAADFVYTSPANGNFSNTVKAATSVGTVYANATIAASK